MQCIVVNIDDCENSYPLLCSIFPLNPDYAGARSLRSNENKELEVKFTFSFDFIRNHIAKAKIRAC